MDGLDEQLSLLDEVAGRFFVMGLIGVVVGREQVIGELAAGIGIEKQLGVVVSFTELVDDLLRIILDLRFGLLSLLESFKL